MEGEAAQEARQEGPVFELSRLAVDAAEMAAARVENPERSLFESRRVRHRQFFGQDLIRIEINDDAAVGAPVAPAVDHIAAADSRDIAGPALFHTESVQMAAILRRQLADERRFPDGAEA